MILQYQNTKFLTSSVSKKCLHVDNLGVELAFVGYSNSGKSSLINCITNKKKLSRFSKKTGRTRMINFFYINDTLRFVDLPGYGFSLIQKNQKKKIYKLIFNYLRNRKCLKGLILLIDIRRLIRTEDRKILTFSKLYNIHIIIILTKCDKLNKHDRLYQLNILKKQIQFYYIKLKIILFSCVHMIGINDILNEINIWYNKHL
ncbi:Probable GTP-binding protein EngB [Buchnera aphidicola (Pterocallis alni)]|uniref:ribosome biogenesis GTP-binding protein YihA/YsxC n=1 Tax=Buchnera aphidicola TaxID=9 RepID=UPI003463CF86